MLHAQYQQIGHPPKWKLNYSMEAWDPTTGEALGALRKGIEVEVLEVIKDGWIVRYDRIDEPDIVAKIGIPDLSRHYGMSFGSVSETIRDFPLLMSLLESIEPWEQRCEALTTDAIEQSSMWDIPVHHAAFESVEPYPDSPKTLVLTIWNKSTADETTINPTQAYSILRTKLARLERFFSLENYRLPNQSLQVNAIRDDSRRFVLPNDLAVTLRYQTREYLILELQSYKALRETLDYSPSDPYEIAERMKVKKWSSGGHMFLPGIPMIDQGNRGYCASATLARVFQYYGYPVDMHQLADLAETEAQYTANDRRETSYENIIRAARRFCNSTPFSLQQIGNRKADRYYQIHESIERGNPILWLVPGHMRLIIGIHPKTHEIVYSDSWGTGHDFKTMTWDSFENINQQLWVLRRR